ncbi:MAG: hypothetical protein LBI20_04235 [Holosporales bacterium]|jgi:hypothetical protein|nr:hypothetical protein [Holosporales bacterium]
MKSAIKTPKLHYLVNTPFIDGFTEIEKENTEIVIGNSHMIDDLFCTTNESVEYFKCLCSLVPKSEFRDVRVRTRYRAPTVDDVSENVMSFSLYSGEQIRMDGFISELAIRFRELLPLESDDGLIKSEWVEFLKTSPEIYVKTFHKQYSDMEIENTLDPGFEGSDILHVKSKGYFFAGSYYAGIKLSDIQQYLFYVGTEIQAREYINIISATELISSRNIEPAPIVTFQSLSTLEDDVCDGKVVINFPDGSEYQSIAISKNTLVSDIVQMLFKKKKEEE